MTDHKRATPPGTGAQVACALMKRLAKLDVPTVVVAQYDFYVWMDAAFGAEQRRLSQGVLKCAAAAGLGTVDLYDQTEKAVRTEGRNRIYRTWHPSAEGYRLIAEGIAELARRAAARHEICAAASATARAAPPPSRITATPYEWEEEHAPPHSYGEVASYADGGQAAPSEASGQAPQLSSSCLHVGGSSSSMVDVVDVARAGRRR